MRRLFLSLFFISGLLVCPAAIASTNVSGPQSGTWDLAGSPYILFGHVTVNSDSTLTIESGVEIQTSSSSRDIYVYGDLDATGATFTGSYTEIWVGGGVVDLTNCTFTGGCIRYPSGSGTISNCELPYIELFGGTPTVVGNTLTSDYPIRLSDPDGAAGLAGFSGNTYSAGNPQIMIRGTLEGTAALGAVDGLDVYSVTGWLTIQDGGVLTVDTGIEMFVFLSEKRVSRLSRKYSLECLPSDILKQWK